MPEDQKAISLLLIQSVLERASAWLVALAAVTLCAATAAGFMGLAPMLSLTATLGEGPLEVGPWLQAGAAFVLLAVAASLPAGARVRRLEAGHRSFRVGMEDVARAYWAAHAADRVGIFKLSREFDAVKERYEFLKRHPKLGEIEPELLELAAQMSTEARDLAAIYSDEAVARAHTMLVERKCEVEHLSKLIDTAHAVTRDIRGNLQAVEMDEDIVRSRISVLREELSDLWTEIDGGGLKRRGKAGLRVAAR